MKMSVVYEISGENDRLIPVLMVLDHLNADWSGTLYINIDAPFERFTFEEIDTEVFALAVPDHAYVRQLNDHFKFGIHLPTLRTYIQKKLSIEQLIEVDDIRRLMLRIHDIEDTMQCEVKTCLEWE